MRKEIIGDARLILGDCREEIANLVRAADAFVVDPPYGIDLKSHGQHFCGSRPIAGDEDGSATATILQTIQNFDVPLIGFFSPYAPLAYMRWRSILVWNKGGHVGIGGDRETCWKRDFECIGVRGNRALNGQCDSAVLSFAALSAPPTGHIAEKPVELMQYLVGKLTQAGDVVCDPFCGTATSGVASLRLGRKFVGVEIDAHWFDVACRRIEAEVKQAKFDFVQQALPTKQGHLVELQ